MRRTNRLVLGEAVDVVTKLTNRTGQRSGPKLLAVARRFHFRQLGFGLLEVTLCIVLREAGGAAAGRAGCKKPGARQLVGLAARSRGRVSWSGWLQEAGGAAAGRAGCKKPGARQLVQ